MGYRKEKEQSILKDTKRKVRVLADGAACEESRIRLDKPAPSAVWGTTTIIGKQKK